MTEKLRSTIGKAAFPVGAILLILVIWQVVSMLGLVPQFMLPSPVSVVRALIKDFPLLMSHAAVTMLETLIGLLAGVLIGFGFAVLMDMFTPLYRAFYPLIVLTQTIPTIAIAPLLVLWFGYEMLPKVILVVLVVFFPITVSLLDGFRSVDGDTVNLLRSMGCGRVKLFRYVKLPASLGQFFAGLKISVSYAVVGTVVSEWVGGFKGLGVYMLKVKSGFAYDKMFAVIFLISALSLLMMWLVSALRRLCMPWTRKHN